jgi:hypothetical protein
MLWETTPRSLLITEVPLPANDWQRFARWQGACTFVYVDRRWVTDSASSRDRYKDDFGSSHRVIVTCIHKKWVAGWPAEPPSPFQECRAGSLSTVNAFLEPVQYFFLNPANSVDAKLDPFRELAGRFQAGDVLRRVKYQFLQLPFR